MRNEAVHTEEYKGHTIEVYADISPSNPFEEWDCNPPIAVNYDRGIHCYATKYGNPLEPPALTREQIKANLPDILELTGHKSLLAMRSEMSWTTWDDAAQMVNEAIAQMLGSYMSDSDRLEALASLWNMAGIPAIVRVSRGYVQGAYAEVLAVATPEFQEACGSGPEYWNGPDGIENLEASIKLYGYWAWGDEDASEYFEEVK